jgi:hypothetical protein
VLCLAEAAEFFFVTADGGRNSVQCDTEVGDLGGEPGQSVGFATVGAVFFDDSAQVGVAVEGGSPESGAGGDVTLDLSVVLLAVVMKPRYKCWYFKVPKNRSIAPLVCGNRTLVRTYRSSGPGPVKAALNISSRKQGPLSETTAIGAAAKPTGSPPGPMTSARLVDA